MGDRRIRVLIVDDEPLGRDRLEHLLREHPDVEIVGTLSDGRSAVAEIRAQAPDLVFLDIQMPGISGLDVIRKVGPASMPATVFVTAHDRYALQAFDLTAVDYLLKPYSDERFEEAFQRAKRRALLEGIARMREQLMVLLEANPPRGPAPAEGTDGYLERIAVPGRGQLRVIAVDDIDYVEASGVYAEFCVGQERHLVRESLQGLEEQLDPAKFVRSHRSWIVRLDRVQALIRGQGGNYSLRLRDGTAVPVGRTYREEVERRLGRRA